MKTRQATLIREAEQLLKTHRKSADVKDLRHAHKALLKALAVDPGNGDERYTPPELMDRVSASLRGQFKDVCPRRGLSGLARAWESRVYCNAPGTLMMEFASRFYVERSLGRMKAGIWCYFNWDHSTEWFAILDSFAPVYVLLEDRWRFPGPGGVEMDVGRSQAFGLFGDCDPTPFEDIARIVYPTNRSEVA